jgi:adenosine deaminase
MPNILVSTLGTWSILPEVVAFTDNPGISRTDFTSELHRAARLTEGGLSIWDLFLLIRNGFKASFLERSVKHRLIRDAERDIMAIVQQGLPGL